MWNLYPSHLAWAIIKRDMQDCSFLSDDSHFEKCWRWRPGALQQGWERREQHPIHTNNIDPWAGLLRRPYAHIYLYLYLYIWFFSYCHKKKCSVFRHQIVSRLFWWAGWYLGWVGHFAALRRIKWQQTRPGTGEKLLLFCDVAVIRKKKDPSAVCRTFPQGPPDCNVLPGLESQCVVAFAPEACWAPKAASFILISSRTFMYGLTCAWAGC